MKPLTILPITLILLAALAACVSKQSPTTHSTINMTTPLTDTFPFLTYAAAGSYAITLPAEDEKVMDRYAENLSSLDLSGSGYSWEGIILQLLDQHDPALSSQFNFDSEAGAFYCTTTSEDAYLKFLHLLAPILQDPTQFRQALSKIDRNRIDD
jgi:hypothetical protein